jgi:FKBP-type peptidyl-prolyl cis-trans isomerase FklB
VHPGSIPGQASKFPYSPVIWSFAALRAGSRALLRKSMMRSSACLVLALALFAASPIQAQTPPPAAPAVSGADFLAANLRAPGVKALPSGLQYKVVRSGPAGPSPKPGDVIKVHYEGALADGQVFDSSFSRGKPMLMPLDGLVPGWMEALPRMRVGDEWMLYVPPSLGYGESGAGPIPPGSVLVFRIQLLGMLSAD